MRSIAVEIAAVNEAMGEIRSGGDAVQASAQELSRLARELTAAADAFKLPPSRAADVSPLRLE
jgi:methyl-accepting chemotaxis protein